MAAEKRETTTVRVLPDASKNCVEISKALGEPFTYNSVVELAMLLITKEQIIEHLKKKK